VPDKWQPNQLTGYANRLQDIVACCRVRQQRIGLPESYKPMQVHRYTVIRVNKGYHSAHVSTALNLLTFLTLKLLKYVPYNFGAFESCCFEVDILLFNSTTETSLLYLVKMDSIDWMDQGRWQVAVQSTRDLSNIFANFCVSHKAPFMPLASSLFSDICQSLTIDVVLLWRYGLLHERSSQCFRCRLWNREVGRRRLSSQRPPSRYDGQKYEPHSCFLHRKP
jgi:hypothetical protein